jgi:GNAT superfamily N-acetyltransferase
VEVRRAEIDDERRLAARIAADVFGVPYVEPAPPDSGTVVYLAFVDGQAAGRATGSFSEHGVTLFGGAVLPEARGRGAYRALVRARWATPLHVARRLRSPTAAASHGRSSLGSASASSARSGR